MVCAEHYDEQILFVLLLAFLGGWAEEFLRGDLQTLGNLPYLLGDVSEGDGLKVPR